MSEAQIEPEIDPAVSTPSNPFATRFVRPGAIEFQFSDGGTAEKMVDDLKRSNWNGQIVGPHGSGKTTLLESLLPICEQRGKRVFRYTLHNRQRRCDPARTDQTQWNADCLIVVDGFEQLTFIRRWQLRIWCYRAQCGLLITTHRAWHGPTLYSIQPTSVALERIVAHLTAKTQTHGRPTRQEIQTAYRHNGGNCREALMQLYDVWQHAQDASRSF